MHQCSVCCKGFPSASKLQRHYLIHTGQKPFTCLICGKDFRQSVHLKKHSETHAGNYHNWSPPTDSLQHTIPVPTNLDPSLEKSGHDLITDTPLLPTAYFQRDGTMQRTQPETYTTASEIKPQPELFPPADNGLFSSQQNTQPGGHFFTDLLQDNMIGSDGMENSAWHTDDVHTCTVCLMCFSSSHQLQRHLPVHSQPKPFECNICGKAFRLRAHLKMHSQIHERRPTGFSKTISMLGSQQSSSRGRMRVNHECPTCSKTFCSPSKLKRHFLTHTGQKPFSCEDCGKTFRQVSHLKTHLFASHNKSNLQSVCTKQKEKRIGARNTNVEMELQCEISVDAPQHLEKLETKSLLPVKVEPNASDTSQFQCSICSKTFTSSIRHRQHYMMHKEVRPFQCRVCGRTFRLSIHLKRHQVSHKNQDESQNTSQVDDPRDAVSVSKTEHAYQNSDKAMTSPEPNDSKALDLDIIVKPEHWKPNVKDDKDFPVSTLQEPESTATSHLKMPVFGQTSSQRKKISQKTKNQQLNHQCLACLKSFPSPSKLQRHMLTHTGQRPFGCHTCGKRFRQPTHLRIHSRTHLLSKNGKQRYAPRSRPPSRRITEHRESPVDVQFQEKLPEKHSSDRNVHLNSPTERQSGQGSTFACGHNESNSKMHWFQHSTSSLSKPQLCLQMPPETTLKQSGHLQLKNQAKSSTGKVNEAPFLSTGPELALKGADAISVGSTSHNKHQCLLCLKYFPSASKLQRHNLVHTGLRPFQCLACGKTFRQATHLKVHEGTHKWRPFRPASRQGNRMKVRRQQQLQYPKVCVQVPVASPMKTETFHSNGVNEWRPFQDNFEDTCNNQPKAQRENISNSSKQSIPNKVTCAKRKAHLCTICQKGFDTPSKLSRHFLIHTGIRPFKCSSCTKTFRQPCHLRSHERRTHENKTCSDVQDNGTYRDPDHETLTSAQGKILSDMPQSYKDCSDHCTVTDEGLGHSSETGDPSFVTIQDIGLPDDNMESGSRQSDDYWCTECHSHFLSPSELATHVIVHRHSLNNEMTGQNSLQQEMGGHMHSMQMAFQTNQVIADADSHNVIQNERLDHYWGEPIHTSFQCDTCITSFETERDLQFHKCDSRNQVEVTQLSTYRCAICFKDFKTPSKLQRHYVTHTGERPFQCKVCEKTFTQASHLKTHQRTHKLDTA